VALGQILRESISSIYENYELVQPAEINEPDEKYIHLSTRRCSPQQLLDHCALSLLSRATPMKTSLLLPGPRSDVIEPQASDDLREAALLQH